MNEYVLFAASSSTDFDPRLPLEAMGYSIRAVRVGEIAHYAGDPAVMGMIIAMGQERHADFLEVFVALRKLNYYPPVLLIAPQEADPTLPVKALKCGCDAFATSPVDPYFSMPGSTQRCGGGIST